MKTLEIYIQIRGLRLYQIPFYGYICGFRNLRLFPPIMRININNTSHISMYTEFIIRENLVILGEPFADENSEATINILEEMADKLP